MTASNILEQDVQMSKIYSDPDWNCRSAFGRHTVADLAKEIADLGLLQPILLVPYDKAPYKYKVIAGHRRHAAVKSLKWEVITAKIISGLTDLQCRKINLCENIQRKDLNILEEARALKDFVKAGWSNEVIANELVQSKSWVRVRLFLLDLEPDIQECAAAGLITQKQICQIHDLPVNERYNAVRLIKDAKLRGDATDPIEKAYKKSKHRKDPFKRKKREPEDIFDMLSYIYDTIGPSILTRGLAWAAGEISDMDLYRDIRDEAKSRGVNFSLPEGVQPLDQTNLKG